MVSLDKGRERRGKEAAVASGIMWKKRRRRKNRKGRGGKGRKKTILDKGERRIVSGREVIEGEREAIKG